MTIDATVRWSAPSTNKPGVYTVVVQEAESGVRWVLWTRDHWLAALCERKNQTPRPELSVTFDRRSKQLEGVGLPVAEAS